MAKARVFKIVKRFSGYPTEEDFEMVEEELQPLRAGEVLGKTLYLSVDPYMRIFVRNLPLGSPMIGGAVASRTAYFGLLDVCKPLKAGETVLVNGAAGAVGNVVGQIAKIKGCTVIGFAGTDEKVDYLKSIGFDFAFNYKTVELHETLTQTVPGGIDAFFDNVGGEFSDTVILQHMKEFGRVAICGSISQYNLKPSSDAEVGKGPFDTQTMGPRLQGTILGKQLKIEGFMAPRYVDRSDEANRTMTQWLQEGKLKWREHVTEGFQNMPKAFIGMLKGDNIGKAVVKNTDL